MNTPKSQNPEGRVVAYVQKGVFEACGMLANATNLHRVMIAITPQDTFDVPIYTATALADIQADREMLVADCQESRERAEKHWRRAEDAERKVADMQRRLERMEGRVRAAMAANDGGLEGSWIRWRYDTFKEMADELAYERALLRDGKGDGVFTDEGEGK